MLDTPPDDWPDDPDLVPVPGFSATEFIAEAKAARAPVVLDRHDGTTIDEEDGKPGPPMLMAGFLHEGKVTYVVTCDEGGVEVRAEIAGITVEDKVALEALQERLHGKVRTFARAVRVSSPGFLVHPEEAMREEWATRAPVLPTQTMLVEDAARYRSAIDEHFGRIGHSYDDRYTDFSSSGTPVPQRLRPLVDAIVGDPDYGHHLDQDGRDRIARRHAGHLDEDEFEAVAGAAYYTFKYTIGKVIGFHALPWARQLAAHPDVRPEWRTADLERWVDNQLRTGRIRASFRRSSGRSAACSGVVPARRGCSPTTSTSAFTRPCWTGSGSPHVARNGTRSWSTRWPSCPRRSADWQATTSSTRNAPSGPSPASGGTRPPAGPYWRTGSRRR